MFKDVPIVFVSFADDRLKRSRRRLNSQVQKFNLFDSIYLYSERDVDGLPSLRGTRGYGYWYWKPRVVSETLDKVNAGSVLVYSDIGCHFNVEGKNRFLEYLNFIVSNDFDLLVFSFSEDDWFSSKEVMWTKRKLVEYFNLSFDSVELNSNQLVTTFFICRNNARVRSFIHSWHALVDERSLVNDDLHEEHPLFIEHRHDQSIFSLLLKRSDLKYKIIDQREIWNPLRPINFKQGSDPRGGGVDWRPLTRMPVLAKRDKDYSFFVKFRRKCSAIFLKLSIVKERYYG